MSFKSPLARARGLGSAKDGVLHWWMQRLTGIILVPLLLWLSFSVAKLSTSGYEQIYHWVSYPVVTILLIASSLLLFYHSSLGIQVVAEDYIANKPLKLTILILVNFFNFILVIVSVFYCLKIAFGS